MRKRLTCLVLCLVTLVGLALPAMAAEPPAVYVDGVAVADARAVVVDGNTYVSLYWVTLALRPDAVTQWETDRLVSVAPDFTLSAKIGDCYLTINDRYLYLADKVKAHDTGDTLVPVRALATALGAEVTWDGAVQLKSGGKPLLSGGEYYSETDVDLLAKVIYHESGHQPFEGQLAVGNVILNRVKSPIFPNNVNDVVYQKGQFPGATKCTPDSESILAAKLCLDGAVVLDSAYWFNGAGKACWASRNKTCIATIGGHAFYG